MATLNKKASYRRSRGALLKGPPESKAAQGIEEEILVDHLRAMVMHVTGATNAEIGKTLGVAPRTVTRWLHQPTIRLALEMERLRNATRSFETVDRWLKTCENPKADDAVAAFIILRDSGCLPTPEELAKQL